MELFWGTRNSWTQPGHEVVLQQVGWWLILKRNTIVWVNYNDLTATSLGMMVSRGDYPQMTLIQVSELLQFTQNDSWIN